MLSTHYKPKKISKIEKSDKRVAIVGKVHSVGSPGSSFVLDDETGKVEVFISETHVEDKNKLRVKIKNGELLRVFCSIEDDRLSADVVQSLKDLDFSLLKEVDDLYAKARI